MLASLWIKGYALIDALTLRFEPGFTVLTGETGAGKSILVGALQLALGERADLSALGDGGASAEVVAEFAIPPGATVAAALGELDISPDDGRLVLSRRLSRDSGSSCRINGRPATVSMLRQVGACLVDFHGQHEHQSLLRPTRHLDLVDAFGGQPALSARDHYRALFGERQATVERLAALSRDDREARRRVDLLRHQVAEIDAAALSPDDEERLLAQRKVLANAAQLAEGTAGAAALLSADDPDRGARELLVAAVKLLTPLTEADPGLGPLVAELESAAITAEESARGLSDYAAGVESDPRKLHALEDRLSLIHDLKRKYGDTLTEVLAYRDRAADELGSVEHADEQIAGLKNRLAVLEGDLMQSAARLSELRRAAAARLTDEASERLRRLGMAEGILSAEHEVATDIDGLSARGADRLQFLVVTNPGQAPLPFVKIASGGEIARTMLALRAVAALEDAVPTMVYDEIDAGIGGRALAQVGDELLRLTESSTGGQVICVTHSPQIAALAHHHVAVRKAVQQGRAVVTAHEVAGIEREAELARMLGADGSDEAAAQHAEVLARQGAKARRSQAARPAAQGAGGGPAVAG